MGEGSRLIVVRKGPPEDLARLRRSVETLRRASGSGVVEIVSVEDTGDEIEVALAFAGRPLSAPLDGRSVARIGASVAASAADLHARGLSHGALQADHVLVDAADVIRLCGLGSSAEGTPSGDVQDLGVLLLSLLDERDSSDAATAVRGLAERCSHEPGPSMSAVAAGLAAAHGPRTTCSTAAPRRRRAPSTRAVALSVATLGAVALGALVWPTPTRHHQRIAMVTTTTHPTTTTVLERRATRVWPAERQTIEGNGARWTWQSSADDWPLLGAWRCDGEQMPALVQRATGAVWIVDQWPEVSAEAVTARYVTTVDGVTDVSVAREEGCDVIVLTTRGGRAVRVTPA